jgi:hypothetical protein
MLNLTEEYEIQGNLRDEAGVLMMGYNQITSIILKHIIEAKETQ